MTAGPYYLRIDYWSTAEPDTYIVSWSYDASTSGRALAWTSFAPRGGVEAHNATRTDDWYSLNASAGLAIRMTLQGEAGTDFDVYVYDQSNTSTYIARAFTGSYPEVVQFRTVSSLTLFKIHRVTGGGAYRMEANTIPLPGTPSGIAATDGQYADKVQVTWNPSSEASSYKLYRNTTNNSATATQQTATTFMSYDDTSAVAGTDYYYWVMATNLAGDSGFSAVNAGYRAAIPLPPTGVAATDATDPDKVRVTWNASNRATGYKVLRSTTNSSGTATQVGALQPASPLDDTSAVAGTLYYYWVKATNVAGDSTFSSVDSGSRLAAPNPPTGVTATMGDFADKVRVSWSTVTGASTYKVYRNTTPNTATATPIGAPQTVSPLDDTSAVAPVVYYYWVVATNLAGDSAFSAYAAGFREIAAPLNVQASDGTFADKVRVTWNSVAGANGYRVYRNTTNSSATATQIGTPGTSPYDDATAVATTLYYYWVRACIDADCGVFSASNSGSRAAPATGTINVTTNRTDAPWTISSGGSTVYNGTGNWSQTGVAPGTYTINWQNVAGCTPSPATETNTLAAGSSIAFNNTYTCPPATGTINVTTNRTDAPWTISSGGSTVYNGTGNWSQTGVAPGTYTINWQNVAGCTPSPATETNTLAAGSSIAFNNTYTCPPATGTINVTTNRTDAPWTISSGGSTVYNGTGNWSQTGVAPGTYTINWQNVAGCTPSPATETNTLAAGSSIAFNSTYTCPPATGTINVTTNRTDAPWTISSGGSTVYNGTGNWSQTGVVARHVHDQLAECGGLHAIAGH